MNRLDNALAVLIVVGCIARFLLIPDTNIAYLLFVIVGILLVNAGTNMNQFGAELGRAGCLTGAVAWMLLVAGFLSLFIGAIGIMAPGIMAPPP